MPPEFAASIVALLVTLLASTKTEARLKLPPEAVAKFRALTLPLLMTELPPAIVTSVSKSKPPEFRAWMVTPALMVKSSSMKTEPPLAASIVVPDLIVSSMRARKAPEPKAPMFA